MSFIVDFIFQLFQLWSNVFYRWNQEIYIKALMKCATDVVDTFEHNDCDVTTNIYHSYIKTCSDTRIDFNRWTSAYILDRIRCGVGNEHILYKDFKIIFEDFNCNFKADLAICAGRGDENNIKIWIERIHFLGGEVIHWDRFCQVFPSVKGRKAFFESLYEMKDGNCYPVKYFSNSNWVNVEYFNQHQEGTIFYGVQFIFPLPMFQEENRDAFGIARRMFNTLDDLYGYYLIK